MSTGLQSGTGGRKATRPTRRAWIAVGFMPVGFVLAMVLGEGLLAMQGYDSADSDVPLRAIALAGGTGIVVFAIPCVLAWVLGRRAVAAGEPQGRVPALLGAVIGLVFLAQNLLGLIFR